MIEVLKEEMNELKKFRKTQTIQGNNKPLNKAKKRQTIKGNKTVKTWKWKLK